VRSPAWLVELRDALRRVAGPSIVPVAVAVVALAALAAPAVVAPPAGAASSPGAPRPQIYQGGGVIGFGDAQPLATVPPTTPLNSVMVAIAADPSGPGQGYWLAAADGGVFTAGDAGFYGSLGALPLVGPVIAITPTPDGQGYWLAAMDGGVFSFGDAQFYGSMGGHPLNAPVVGMAATPDGEGYWLVARDGGVFSFGNAQFYGSMGGHPLNAPMVGMAATPDGEGYWLVAADGGVFSFGDAQFYGSMGGQALSDPVVGVAATHDGGGYVEVLSNGVVYTFGDARPFGSLAGGYGGDPANVPPIAGIALTPGDGGYWLLEPDGWNYSFVNPSSATSPTGATITSVADTQVRNDPVAGYFCNPYGPCEAWCSLFATWVWRQAGVPIPSYAFTGDMYYWAQSHTAVLPPTAAPVAGDAVLFGTGPWSVSTSLHVGLVAQRWPDGAIIDIEGDSGPAPNGSLAVTINGPYLPSESAAVNGMPIYAYALP
jgi:hypothetical protein